MQITKVISEVTYLITPEGDWTDKRPIIPCVVHRLKQWRKDTALPITSLDNKETEGLIIKLVDTVDENLEATGEVNIPTKWTEQSTYSPIKVAFPEEEEAMVDLGSIDMPVGQNRTTMTLPEEDTIIDLQDTATAFQNASHKGILPPEENNKTTLKYTNDMDNPTRESPVMQQIRDVAQQPKLDLFQKSNMFQRNKREHEGGTVQGPHTRQHIRLEAEQEEPQAVQTVRHHSHEAAPTQ